MIAFPPTPVVTKRTRSPACPPKPGLAERPLVSKREAHRLGAVFKMLANDTRLRLLHALVRARELCVNDLAAAVGMKPQAVSNQLQRLAGQSLVACRRHGSQFFYRILDPCAIELLDHGWCLAEDARDRKRQTRLRSATTVRGRALPR